MRKIEDIKKDLTKKDFEELVNILVNIFFLENPYGNRNFNKINNLFKKIMEVDINEYFEQKDLKTME
jgi:hypothetical protein